MRFYIYFTKCRQTDASLKSPNKSKQKYIKKKHFIWEILSVYGNQYNEKIGLDWRLVGDLAR